jgi:hypothetical protein
VGASPATATGIEHKSPGQIAGRNSRLDEKGRFVFLRPHDVIAIPLTAEAGGIGPLIARQSWDSIEYGKARAACPAEQGCGWLTRNLEIARSARRTPHEAEQQRMHDRIAYVLFPQSSRRLYDNRLLGRQTISGYDSLL